MNLDFHDDTRRCMRVSDNWLYLDPARTSAVALTNCIMTGSLIPATKTNIVLGAALLYVHVNNCSHISESKTQMNQDNEGNKIGGSIPPLLIPAYWYTSNYNLRHLIKSVSTTHLAITKNNSQSTRFPKPGAPGEVKTQGQEAVGYYRSG